LELLDDITRKVQIKLCFLPTYSPELDAVEFVFNQIRGEVKKNRNTTNQLWFDVTCAIATISHIQMYGFYTKALYG
jgi:hypothetical protein